MQLVTLPEELQSLQYMHQFMRSGLNDSNRHVYKQCLRKAINNFGESKDVATRAALSEILLDRIIEQVGTDGTGNVSALMLDECLEVMRLPGVVAAIVQHEINAQRVAYVCMKLIQHYETINYKDPCSDVGTILLQLSNKTVPRSTIVSMNEAAVFIYGQAAWELYSQDVTDTKDLPFYFLSLGLPVAGLKIVETKINTLPHDIS